MKNLIIIPFLATFISLKAQQQIVYSGQITLKKDRVFQSQSHTVVIAGKKVTINQASFREVSFDGKSYQVSDDRVNLDGKRMATWSEDKIAIADKIYSYHYDKQNTEWVYSQDTTAVLTTKYHNHDAGNSEVTINIIHPMDEAAVELLSVMLLTKEGEKLKRKSTSPIWPMIGVATGLALVRLAMQSADDD
ncbi:hypothetical protein KK083_09625 [Fulvivirgaceae bacterium PWU4]|uniref:Uncharacterized protein n=1 Tax=Chryseosolibacter histidini TaxID=2782349 RepID=A0AAP2GIL1_9BACT|nr:hypothetical protein [Chryseosolibacter histidini]MBT1697134.1 hypothetical protein [Chryseosolibacter histidini]